MTMAEIEYTLQDLINFSSSQKPLEFTQALNSLMAQRAYDVIADKKAEMAQMLFHEPVPVENEEDNAEEA
jgi:hypothetical protein